MGRTPRSRIRAWLAGAKQIIHKHDSMADKTVVADDHFGADEGVGLNSGSVADLHFVLNFHKRPDKTVVPQRAAVKIGGQDDFKILTVRNIYKARDRVV